MKLLLVIWSLALANISYSMPTKDKLMIKSVLQVGDQTIFPSVMVFNGETAIVEIDSLRLELQPSIVDDDVLIKTKVFKLIKGEAILLSSPKVLAKFGKKVSITTYSDDNRESKINLRLTAQRSK